MHVYTREERFASCCPVTSAKFALADSFRVYTCIIAALPSSLPLLTLGPRGPTCYRVKVISEAGVADLFSWKSFKKLFVTLVGPFLVLMGILLLVLPGPGLLLIAAGITLLGTEYHWARRLIAPIKRRLEAAKAKKPTSPSSRQD